MKRIKNWLEDICWGIDIEYWQSLVAVVIGIILFIGSAIWYFVDLDRVPATAEDYAPLEQQIVAIQENRDLLFITDSDVTVRDSVTTITLTSERVDLTVRLNETFEVLEIIHTDNSYTFWGAIGTSALVGVMVGLLGGFALWLVLWILYFFVWLFSKFHRPKKQEHN